jgi:uncharacterized protein DUF6328
MATFDGTVASLQQKVRNALDEVRMLMLGCQVLLGFQYRGFFEKGYEQLEPASRIAEVIGLFALLATLTALFLAPARHRMVEQGNDSEPFHRFTMTVMRISLLPFAIGLTAALFVAGDRTLGRTGGAVVAALTALAALAFWYGHYLRRDRRKDAGAEDRVEKTNLEQRIVQVLTEARVVLPGAQALLGFQLAMVLMEAFDKLSATDKLVHLVSIGFMALTTIVLMAPTAYHRIVEAGEDTERFHRFASRMVLLALALIAPSFAGDLYVVLRKGGYESAALPSALAALACFYACWFGVPRVLRARRPHARRVHRIPAHGQGT